MKFEYKYGRDKRGHHKTTCILRDKKDNIIGVGRVIRYHKDVQDREYGRAKAYCRAFEDHLRRLQKSVGKKSVSRKPRSIMFPNMLDTSSWIKEMIG